MAATELESVSAGVSISNPVRRSAWLFVLVVLISTSVLLAPPRANAGRVIDYIRNHDLNDYSLGLSYANSQSAYVGTTNSLYVYPYLTSFTHSAFTDDWLLIRDDNLGIRYITDNQWEFGLLARMQLTGTSIPTDAELAGINEKQWAVEAGPLIGWRAKPLNFQFRTYWEMPNRHDGITSELEISLPIQFARGFVVPAVRLAYLSEDYTDYYYSVSEAESTPTRPAYQAGAATTVEAFVSLGYELTPRWLLRAKLGVEFLDSSISASPIVARDQRWSGSVGFAYDADLFEPRGRNNPRSGYGFEFRLGAFNGAISTEVERRASDGQPQDTTDLENLLDAADNKTFLQLDGRFRINNYHQVQLGYFALQRQSSTTLENDHTLGDEFYAAGTEIATETDFSLLQFSYAYSLMHDGQKELGVKAGLSYTKFDIALSEAGSQEKQQLKAHAPLPTIGALGTLSLGDHWALGANLNLFALDFDQYSGFMAYMSLDLDRQFGDVFRAGVGYNFYALSLAAKNEDLGGEIDLRIHGPKAYISLSF